MRRVSAPKGTEYAKHCLVLLGGVFVYKEHI
nr:MAG TPA: Protein of unknown function (DUF3012) [Caudoviricetes sp.]